MYYKSLIFNAIFLCSLFSAELQASCPVNKETSCRTSPQMSLVQELARSEKVYQKAALQDSVFKELQLNSLQRVEEI